MPILPTMLLVLSCGHWVETQRGVMSLSAAIDQRERSTDLQCQRCPAAVKSTIFRILMSVGSDIWVEAK